MTVVKAIDDARYAAILADAEARDPWAWSGLYLTGHLGLRVTELTLLEFGDFARLRRDGFASCPTVKKRSGEVPRLPVYVNDRTAQAIERALVTAREVIAAGPRANRTRVGISDPLFRVTARRWQQVWRAYADRAGAPELGIHSLRHWFGVTTYGATRDLVFTRDQMRHTDVSATQVYARIVDGRERAKAVQGIGGSA